MTTWTHVGTTTGTWDQRVGPAGVINVTSHASTQNGDLVMIHLGGHNSTGVPTLTGLGFTHAAGAGNVGTFYRSDVTGATTWNVFNSQSRGAMWVCQTLRPGAGGTNPTVSGGLSPTLDGNPEDFSSTDLMVARMGISGYVLEADADVDDLNVTGDDPNYQELHSKVVDSVVHQLGPTRFCETYIQSFTLLDSSLRNGAVSWTRTDTGSPLSPSVSTPVGSGKYILSYTAAAPPTGSLNLSSTNFTVDDILTATVTAEDGDIPVDDWSLDFGDATTPDTGIGAASAPGIDVEHQYAAAGIYDVTLTINYSGGPLIVGPDSVTVTEHIPTDEEGGGSIYIKRHVTARALPYYLNTGMLEGVPQHGEEE